jgi:hypothetical protein
VLNKEAVQVENKKKVKARIEKEKTGLVVLDRYSLYLLYWWTKVQILTQLRPLQEEQRQDYAAGTQFTCFTCTKVQMLTAEELVCRSSSCRPACFRAASSRQRTRYSRIRP